MVSFSDKARPSAFIYEYSGSQLHYLEWFHPAHCLQSEHKKPICIVEVVGDGWLSLSCSRSGEMTVHLVMAYLIGRLLVNVRIADGYSELDLLAAKLCGGAKCVEEKVSPHRPHLSRYPLP